MVPVHLVKEILAVTPKWLVVLKILVVHRILEWRWEVIDWWLILQLVARSIEAAASCQAAPHAAAEAQDTQNDQPRWPSVALITFILHCVLARFRTHVAVIVLVFVVVAHVPTFKTSVLHHNAKALIIPVILIVLIVLIGGIIRVAALHSIQALNLRPTLADDPWVPPTADHHHLLCNTLVGYAVVLGYDVVFGIMKS